MKELKPDVEHAQLKAQLEELLKQVKVKLNEEQTQEFYQMILNDIQSIAEPQEPLAMNICS